MTLYQHITELIGKTPIVKLNRMVPEDAADVYVKLEAFNPGFSVKDRIAFSMIKTAEQQGVIKPGDTIIEASSGNTGIGLAWVGASLGYHVIIVMPESMSLERRKLIQAYGAELILTPATAGMPGAIQKAHDIAKETGAFMPQQFQNPANPKIHQETTAMEIIESFGGKSLDAFVAGVGTGGTISGISHSLKKVYPNISIYAVEADESAVLSGEQPAPHKIQGISAGFIPDTLDTKSYDYIFRVSSEKAITTGRNIGNQEGFLLGISSSAAVYAAIQIAKQIGKGKTVLALAPDNGERYLSTTLYDY